MRFKIKRVKNNRVATIMLMVLVLFISLMTAGCGANQPVLNPVLSDYLIKVTGEGVQKVFTVEEMYDWESSAFQSTYSVINNWPSSRFYAAEGIKLSAILKQAGLYDSAKLITFKSADGYNCSFTREQLLETERYYFPGLLEENAAGAVPVEVILSYAYIEGSSDMTGLSMVQRQSLDLIFGQANVFEQTNIAFVANVSEIIVSSDEPEAWKTAATYPLAGKVKKGDTVKLEHPEMAYGVAKIYYTLDGTDPDGFSNLYNPSTYQPELLVPITITEDTTIKVKVIGFGKKDSEVKTYQFTIQ